MKCGRLTEYLLCGFKYECLFAAMCQYLLQYIFVQVFDQGSVCVLTFWVIPFDMHSNLSKWMLMYTFTMIHYIQLF